MAKQRQPKPPLTQRESWNCGLCPQDNYPRFATAQEMRQHAADVHDLPLDQTERLKRVAVTFSDGRDGFAQQVHNWLLPDKRLFATLVWTRSREQPTEENT